jgi:hypothetical protein
LSEQDPSAPGTEPQADPHAEMIRLGRAFLVTLIAGVRTAVHTPEDPALEEAAESVHRAAEALFNATGGFSIRFTEASAILNGVKIAFDGGSYGVILRRRLEERRLSSIGIKRPPSVAAIRKLISLFIESPSQAASSTGVTTQDLSSGHSISLPAPSPEAIDDASTDRGAIAIEAIARLVLALREQRSFIEQSRQNVTTSAPLFRYHLAHELSSIIDLARERSAVLVGAAARMRANASHEVRATGVSVLAIAMGQALSLGRSDLLDIGLAGALLRIGRADAIGSLEEEGGAAEDPDRAARAGSIARILGHGARSPSALALATIIAGRPHPLSKLVHTAAAFMDIDPEIESDAALRSLRSAAQETIDRRAIDVLDGVLNPESFEREPAEPPAESNTPPPKEEAGPASRTGAREKVHATGIRLPWMEKKPKEPTG